MTMMVKLLGAAFFILPSSFFISSCADYNETDDFKAQPDPSVVVHYQDLAPVKTYINRNDYPNLKLGVQLNVSDFNKQDMAHAVAVTNFDNVTFGTTLMSGKIINEKGVMNFLDMMDMLDHVEEIGYEVYGSPIFANANQADAWLKKLTSPIEIPVDFVEGKEVSFNDMSVGKYGDYATSKASIVKYDNQNVLKISSQAEVNIIDGFEVDPMATYTTTFWAKADKDITFDVNFSGTAVVGTGVNGKWALKSGKWTKIVVEAQSAEGETDGYLQVKTGRGITIYIQKVQVGYYPDNHRPQTDKERMDTINYALRTWCDGLMKVNAGRIQSFDLIDEPINTKAELENSYYDLKHASADQIFWQDVLGSENYAPVVSKLAGEAYEKYEGDPSKLKFFISEIGLENQKTFESLNYWINVWVNKGAKIDGINAKLSLTYNENPEKQEQNKAAIDNLINNLASTGKLVRLSNFDIKYIDAAGQNVAASTISEEQRQNLADYYGYIIKRYMTTVQPQNQAGICKSNMSDTNDPVGLWSIDTKKEWIRTATYKAFCDALSGN